MRGLLKAALACLLLSWQCRKTQSCCWSPSLVCICFNPTAWAMLTSEDLSAMTILVFGDYESQVPFLHSDVPAWRRMSISPCALLPAPPRLSHSSVTITVKTWIEEPGVLGSHKIYFIYQQFLRSSFLLNLRYNCKVSNKTGTPILAILGLDRVWWDTVLFCAFPTTGSTCLFIGNVLSSLPLQA